MERKVFCIGNAHIDPVWLWTWQEGFAEIKATFRSALDRIRECDDFVFTAAGASYYQWIEENEPDMFREIQEQVRLGRWVLAGGWWLQPDCNAPAGESFARHALYGQKYLYKKFGKIATFGYNVDSFGHNGNLPQLYAQARISNYVMMRPGKHEKGDIQNYTFWWEGIDGTRLLTFRIPTAYCSKEDGADLPGRLQEVLKEAERSDLPVMLFYGVGNHGGGPTKAALERLHQLQKEHPAMELASPEQFFREVREQGGAKELVQGDLQHHAIGCYSANASVKAHNRQAENRLIAAEKLMTVASEKAGMQYRGDEMERAWQRVMFNQFHDILGGCSIKEAYPDVRNEQGEALSIAGKWLNFAAQRLSWKIDTMGQRKLEGGQPFRFEEYEKSAGGFPIVIFNPNPFPSTVPVVLSRKFMGIADENGAPLRFQNVRSSKSVDERGIDVSSALLVELPALGYRTIYARRESAFEFEKSGRMLKYNAQFMENDWFRLEMAPGTGGIRRLYDKQNGVEFAGDTLGVGKVHEDFEFDTWAHAVDYLGAEIGGFADAKLSLVSFGELFATIKSVSRYKNSWLEQEFTLYRDLRDIDVKVRVNWQEPFKTLKMSFPLNVVHGAAFYEIPYGVIEKPANGMEEPGQSFVAVAGRQGETEISLAVVGDSKYSYSVSGNDARFVAVRSCGFADHFGIKDEFTEPQDIGIHEFRYSLMPRVGRFVPTEAIKKALTLNQPPVLVYETLHEGELPLTDSFASLSNEHTLLTALKRSEDGRRTIARVVEASGAPQQTELILNFLKGIQIPLSFRPFEVKTVAINEDGTYEEVDFLEGDFR